MTEKEMIDKLKNTWTTIGGLTLDEKVFIEQNIRSCVEVDIYGHTDEAELPLRIGALVRLKADFTLPQDRWFYSNKGFRLICISGAVQSEPHPSDNLNIKHDLIEVPPADLEYVRAQIERHKKGEIDLSKYNLQSFYKEGDTFIFRYGGEQVSKCGLDDCVLMFVRKAEAKKSGGWKEFEVFKREGVNGLWINMDGRVCLISEAWLYAIDRGMCPQFWFEGQIQWWEKPTLTINDKPANLLKMRVWEEGK